MAVSTGDKPRRRWQRKLSRDLYRTVKVFFRPDFSARPMHSGPGLEPMEFFSQETLSALLAIIVIDLVLAGDNAIVIALAARSLPAQLQKKAIIWGTVGAIGVRVVMTVIVVWLLMVPGLRFLGGLALVWIAWKLLAPKHEDAGALHRVEHRKLHARRLARGSPQSSRAAFARRYSAAGHRPHSG